MGKLRPAVEIAIGNKRTWLELDSPREVSGDKLKYFIAYAKKKYDLGFKIHLKKFKMTHYEGSQIPKSYESTVLVDGRQDPVVISMNEPLEHRGFKLYQSSFEKDERGEPTASILSVNYDPGRSVKYIGSILLVLGIATMFYIKPKWTRRKITT
jgi:cytochrome c biogenesis protein ResB